MKALVYNGPGRRYSDDVPEPAIQDPEDALVGVDAVTICGTDLHILKGDVPTVESPRILGHEAVGTVLEVGGGVRRIQAGDRCWSRASARVGGVGTAARHGTGSAWVGEGGSLGHRIDGTQAEKVRVPFADTSVYPLPDSASDEAALMLADICRPPIGVVAISGAVRPGDVAWRCRGGADRLGCGHYRVSCRHRLDPDSRYPVLGYFHVDPAQRRMAVVALRQLPRLNAAPAACHPASSTFEYRHRCAATQGRKAGNGRSETSRHSQSGGVGSPGERRGSAAGSAVSH